MPVFYTTNVSADGGTLPETESKHAVKVLRLREGDAITVTDGKGHWYESQIEQANPRACTFRVRAQKAEPHPRTFRLHMAVAPTKNSDRFEAFLEKATEIGVDSITPLLCAHSERKKIHADRLQRILLAAMKQSQRATLPELRPLQPFEEFIAQRSETARYIAHCHTPELPFLTQAWKPADSVCMLIGPEGDFSLEEIDAARSADFGEISLGKSRLRTETAALVACTLINAQYEVSL